MRHLSIEKRPLLLEVVRLIQITLVSPAAKAIRIIKMIKISIGSTMTDSKLNK